ncbi:MAG: hypothetical protein IPI69_09925 [Bacteroidales bacterium]|nr:hypothetical protein [Bacteroidales bacterium]
MPLAACRPPQDEKHRAQGTEHRAQGSGHRAQGKNDCKTARPHDRKTARL